MGTGSFYVMSNDNLTSLIGVENIDLTNIDRIYIQNNTKLESCALINICEYLNTPKFARFENNKTSSECFSNAELISSCILDSDNDNVPDIIDNCINISNPTQINSDSDSFGDICDNCIVIENENQIDTDGDGSGDACEELTVKLTNENFQVEDGSIYIENATKGIVMKNANGDCYKITIDDVGNLISTLVNCPN